MTKKKKTSVLDLPVSWKTFALRLFKDINQDGLFKASAALSYYLTLAVFPAFIFLLSLFTFLKIDNLQSAAIRSIQSSLPGDAKLMFQSFINELIQNGGVGLLSFGFIAAVWSASSGLAAVIDQLNEAYKVNEARNSIKTRLTALLLMGIFVAMLLSTFSIITVSEFVWQGLEGRYDIPWYVLSMITVAKYGFVFFIICMAFAMIYYFGPNVQQKFRFITPGSLLGSAFTIIVTTLLNYYVMNVGSFGKVYGSIGGIIVFMLWLNACGFVLLLGAEINALLEHYNPDGKEKGEKKL